MRVLIACEKFCRVRDAFLRRKHDAWSCDLEEDVLEDYGGPHYTGDVREILHETPTGEPWDMMIAFPPCTYLSGSGYHWNNRRPLRAIKTKEALEFVEMLWNADIFRICIENPVGVLSTQSFLGKPTQIIQPYQFGEDASKTTCLWLKNLPKLIPTKYIEPRLVQWKGKTVKRWANQTDSGQNKLGPSETRSAERGKTYRGIAKAMAEQWG